MLEDGQRPAPATGATVGPVGQQLDDLAGVRRPVDPAEQSVKSFLAMRLKDGEEDRLLALEVRVDVDGVFDLLGGETLKRSFAVVRPGGTVVSVAGLPEPTTAWKDLDRGAILATLFWFASFGIRREARRHGARYRYLFMHPSGSELAELGRMIEGGPLEPVVGRVFPFDEITDAFAYLEGGRTKGKVVVSLR